MSQMPDTIGRYQVVRVLGRGGFGEVFEARDTGLDRRVAIKRLLASHDDSIPRERFLREGRSAARLDHPNIVRVYDVGMDGDVPFIVQEFLEGETLQAVLARTTALDLPIALRILIPVAEGLHAAHAAGLVHRDVKPSNVYLTTNGNVKVIDFGIAAATDRSGLTVAGSFLGTPAYASPEQLEGKRVDARSDIFSFGTVAYHVLSGRQPFEADTILLTIRQVLEKTPEDIADLFPGYPEMADVVRDCLQRDPERRPTSMADVAIRLRQVQAVLTRRDSEWPVVAAEPTPPLTPMIVGGTIAGPVMAPPPDVVALPPSSATVVVESFRTKARAPDSTVPPRPPASAPDQSAGALRSGAIVGRFTIHELVARGQTGHLYRAYDPVRSKLVGLKVIERPDSVAVQRLLRAGRIWLDLTHPRLQRIYEVDPGRNNEPALIVTQLLEGHDLDTMLKQNRLDLAQKIQVALQLCDALDYLHQRGIVHREVKPRNIVVSVPQLDVTLLDSGLARSTSAVDTRYTATGVIVGDMNYMAPEQLEGKFDQRSDVYSLAVVLYVMITGRDVSFAELATATSSLAERHDLPAALVSALRSALQTRPDARCASVREFADTLRVLVPEKAAPVDISKVVVTLHGIRTHASWQRTFSEVASSSGLQCRLDRWNFGRFSLLKFLAPWARTAKVEWFRTTYDSEFPDLSHSLLSTERPSIVAHSFGTYILGYALLRYPYLRFNKVLLCGSILPRDFPWDAIINRGQAQEVRNEFGARDIWTNFAQTFVAGTGQSGTLGFVRVHDRLQQEAFDFAHSEYFERGHMRGRWIPFLRRTITHITPRDQPLEMARANTPWGLWLLYGAVLAAGVMLGRFLVG